MKRMNLGLIESPLDGKDWQYAAKVTIPELPKKFLHPEYPVGKQEKGDCVGWAGKSVKEIQENGIYRVKAFNARFLYQECKKVDSIPGEGTTFRALVGVLSKMGSALETKYYPYPYNSPATNMDKIYEEALNYKIKYYARVNTIEEIKAAIFQQGGCLLGVLWTESFRKLKEKFLPEPGGTILGLHAIAATGWDDSINALRIRNSHGQEWGDNGYCWLPYRLLTWRADVGFRFFNEGWSTVDEITVIEPAKKIVLWVGKKIAEVDDVVVPIDQAPEILNNRVMIPLRFVGEAMKYKVEWDSDEKKVTLYSGR